MKVALDTWYGVENSERRKQMALKVHERTIFGTQRKRWQDFVNRHLSGIQNTCRERESVCVRERERERPRENERERDERETEREKKIYSERNRARERERGGDYNVGTMMRTNKSGKQEKTTMILASNCRDQKSKDYTVRRIRGTIYIVNMMDNKVF